MRGDGQTIKLESLKMIFNYCCTVISTRFISPCRVVLGHNQKYTTEEMSYKEENERDFRQKILLISSNST